MSGAEDLTGVQFASPPVIETALSLEFASLRLGFVEIARAASDWAESYPLTEEHEALPPSKPVVPAPTLDLDWRTGLPPVRLWSLSRDLAWVLQLQHDRLTINWRRSSEPSSYPGYTEMLARYRSAYESFQSRAGSLGLGELSPSVVEYTYVNRMEAAPEEILAVLRPVPDRDVLPGRHLFTRYQSVREVSAQTIPGQTTITAEPSNPGMILTISTRLFAEQIDGDQVWSLVNDAHELSKATFMAFTQEHIQRTQWGRSR